MKAFFFKGKTYSVDNENFLLNQEAWDEEFAKGMALELGMKDGLGRRHWEVLHYIRNHFRETGACPVVHETTRALGMNMEVLQGLFPTGYLRGACLLAGITYMYGWVYYFEEPYPVASTLEDEKDHRKIDSGGKVYRVDLFGYLVDSDEWDEDFALRRAYEMNLKTGLTRKHWQVIRYLRDRYQQGRTIPTVYECCEKNRIDTEELAELFPTGYHRGAVKIAGLPSLGNSGC